MSPMRVQLEPSLRQASMVVPFARRSSVSPTASSCRIVSRVTMVPLSMRSSRTWSVPVCWMVRSSYPSAAAEPGCWMRTYRRTEFAVPGSVAMRAHDSESGPY